LLDGRPHEVIDASFRGTTACAALALRFDIRLPTLLVSVVKMEECDYAARHQG